MTMIPIESLYRPALDSQRNGLDESRIQYFMAHPDEIRGVLVYENPVDGERIVVNGYHRVESARRLSWTHVDTDVRQGTRVDALRYRDLVRKPWSEVVREADSSVPKDR
jgi:hypothetical protein